MENDFDLFEDMKAILMCQYVSDFKTPRYLAHARYVLKHMDLKKYPIDQLSDMARYLYDHDKTFQSSDEAAVFFSKKR